jgi:hypothetical protein
MTSRRIPRSRIILAAMVPFVILALVGLGLSAHKAYRLSSWGRAEATYVGSESVILVRRGGSADHTYSEMHYRFTRQGGESVRLSFLQRASADPLEKSIPILYDPSVEGQITRSEGSRWERASNASLFLWVGLGMATAGLLPCLIGAALLFRELRRRNSPRGLPN